MTCVAPPAPTPPATARAGEKICTTGDCGRPGRRDRPGPPGLPAGPEHPIATVQSASLFLSLSLSLTRLAVLGSGYREFCGAGGDRLGLRQTDQSGSRLLGVRTLSHSLSQSRSHSNNKQLRLSPSDPRAYQGLAVICCDW